MTTPPDRPRDGGRREVAPSPNAPSQNAASPNALPELPPVHESLLPREHSLHRPRHATRQTGALVAAVVFFALPLLALGVGVRPEEFENRRLAPFPSITQGWGFFTGLSPWADDHLPLRAEAVRAVDGISRGLFGEPLPRNSHQRTGGPIQDQRQGSQEQPPMPQVVEGKDGWLYLGDDVVSRCRPKQDLDATTAALRDLRRGVEASGRQFVLLIAPDKSTVVPEHLPEEFYGRDCALERTDQFWRRIGRDAGAVDLRAELRQWGDRTGAPVYPRLDGHWSDEGALVMTRNLAEAVRPGTTTTWAYERTEPWTVAGDLPPLIGRSGQISGDHYALKPDGTTNTVRDVPFDFATPLPLASPATPGTVDRSVGMLGDSFSIRAVPYLNAAFQDLTLLHYGKVDQDGGRQAGRVLADHEVVAVEIVERTLQSGNCILLQPEVVRGITAELAARPLPR
ncbi:hypothetical protein ACFFSW_19930 [Saccharothrix longispora]|uniref:AlgX/AlgJ SGNH hydrolase-like domain-containing protein n=1 Tax=Saccharothrix longispora TaxID=33920 RepID=A0ABU1Q440_9PSEU|nr:hypothetical protein [Saccharothrix longispora]MDR6597456.1 hypothetical protein [Saccharothrix longispora]